MRISLTFQLRLAALNEPYSGNMLGFSGAESKCHYEGKRIGISNFKPFLTTRNFDLESIIIRLKDRDIPIINIKVRINNTMHLLMV